MKKIRKALLMITCVLSLTACGSETTVNEFQQSKVAQVETMAPKVIELMEVIAENDATEELLANYNNIELADWFAYNYVQYTGSSSFVCEGKGLRSGINTFKEGCKELEGFAVVGTPTSVVDDDQIIVNVPVTGTNGTAGSVELIFSNDIYFKMSACTFNLNESFGDLMARAGLNTVIGMGTVFIVLILISLIISAFGFIPKLQATFKKKNAETASAPVSTPDATSQEEELADDTELVAVIAAAIAAYEGTSTDGFQVRSIKRANTKKWQRA